MRLAELGQAGVGDQQREALGRLAAAAALLVVQRTSGVVRKYLVRPSRSSYASPNEGSPSGTDCCGR